MRLLDALRKVANDLNATPAQVSLAWLMSRPSVVPIASATMQQLDDIMGAAQLASGEALDALDRASVA